MTLESTVFNRISLVLLDNDKCSMGVVRVSNHKYAEADFVCFDDDIGNEIIFSADKDDNQKHGYPYYCSMANSNSTIEYIRGSLQPLIKDSNSDYAICLFGGADNSKAYFQFQDLDGKEIKPWDVDGKAVRVARQISERPKGGAIEKIKYWEIFEEKVEVKVDGEIQQKEYNFIRMVMDSASATKFKAKITKQNEIPIESEVEIPIDPRKGDDTYWVCGEDIAHFNSELQACWDIRPPKDSGKLVFKFKIIPEAAGWTFYEGGIEIQGAMEGVVTPSLEGADTVLKLKIDSTKLTKSVDYPKFVFKAVHPDHVARKSKDPTIIIRKR